MADGAKGLGALVAAGGDSEAATDILPVDTTGADTAPPELQAVANDMIAAFEGGDAQRLAAVLQDFVALTR